MTGTLRKLGRTIKGFLVELMMLNDTPHSIAMGVAVGFLVGLTPTVGLQMGIVALISLFIRCNRTAGCAIVWITNPVTMVPIFFFNYVVGARVLQRWVDLDVLTWSDFRSRIEHAFIYDRWYENLVAMLLAFFRLTIQLAGPLWFGSMIVALAFAVPSYFIVLAMVRRHRRKRQTPQC
jgi:uncharacterized protein (DUF2062 family)